MSEKYFICDIQYFICDIQDEDLEVVEKWLIKVSIIDDPEAVEEEGMVNRKLVFELVQEILNDEEQKALELNYEICKLPLYLSNMEAIILKRTGRLKKEFSVYKRTLKEVEG